MVACPRGIRHYYFCPTLISLVFVFLQCLYTKLLSVSFRKFFLSLSFVWQSFRLFVRLVPLSTDGASLPKGLLCRYGLFLSEVHETKENISVNLMSRAFYRDECFEKCPPFLKKQACASAHAQFYLRPLLITPLIVRAEPRRNSISL